MLDAQPAALKAASALHVLHVCVAMLEPTRSRHAVRARTSVLWLLIGLLTQEQQEHKVAVANKAARVRKCRRPTRRREASSRASAPKSR